MNLDNKHKKLSVACEKSKVTLKDVRSVGVRWLFSNTSAWNYERMQNAAFAWSLLPVLRKITTTKGELGEALKRNMAFFNTQPTVGAPLLGVIASLEVARAKGEDISEELMLAVKSGLMGPMAAIGDSLYVGTLNAILLSLCIGLAMQGNLIGPVLYIVIWSALTALLTVKGVELGFKKGTSIMDSPVFSEDFTKRATQVLSILGMTVIGGMSAGFVSLQTQIKWGLEGSETKLQEIFDGLMPEILPFLLVMVLWYFYSKRNVSVLKLMGFVILLGATGSLIGLF